MIPGGLSGQLLGVDAVREFNVVQNGYGAEYGKRPGAQVSLVTMSGTNQFHGTLFEFLRNGVFDARNFFDQVSTVPPPFKRNQFGGSAGGPIRRDKTFIFGSYEGFRQRLAVSEAAIVPDNNARNGYLPNCQRDADRTSVWLPASRPTFALWPVANGPELGGGAALLLCQPGTDDPRRFRQPAGGSQLLERRFLVRRLHHRRRLSITIQEPPACN